MGGAVEREERTTRQGVGAEKSCSSYEVTLFMYFDAHLMLTFDFFAVV